MFCCQILTQITNLNWTLILFLTLAQIPTLILPVLHTHSEILSTSTNNQTYT